jgi:hypothetical protein
MPPDSQVRVFTLSTTLLMFQRSFQMELLHQPQFRQLSKPVVMLLNLRNSNSMWLTQR